MPDSGPDALLDRLVVQGVEFVLVGGFAGVAHGSTQVTLDVDVCCPFSRENLERLARALRDLAPVHRMSPARPPLELQTIASSGFKDLYLDTGLGQLDCLGEITGVGGYPEVLANSETMEFGSMSIAVLGLDALIRAKDAMDRPKDRAMAAELRALRERRGLPGS